MAKRRRVQGYRSQRSGGGFGGWLVWLGVLGNILLIGFAVSEQRGLSLPSFLSFTPDPAAAALRALNVGDYETAITEARTALAVDSADSAAVMTLTRALVYRSYVDFAYEADLAAALDTATDALTANENDANTLAAYAFALQANAQPVAAVDAAERALALEPTHTLARAALALGYARVGSFDTALREAQIAVQQAGDVPEIFEARRAVAIATADLGRYAEAGELSEALIADYRQVVPLYFERALYARQVSDAAAVENAYFTVLTMSPANIKARLRLCEYANLIGERASARTYCTEVTEQAPDLPTGWYQLGRGYFLDGNFAAAQSAFNRCSSLQMEQTTPPDARIFECWYLQGQAAEILGDCPALTSIYDQFRLLATDPRVRETWVYPPEGPPICQ